MFDEFLSFFGMAPIDRPGPGTPDDLMTALGGTSFGDGLLFALRRDDVPLWTRNVRAAYPDVSRPFRPFAYDWLGDCFAETGRPDGGGEVVIFEVGTGKLLRTGRPFDAFLADEIPNAHEQCLLSPFWDLWLSSGGARPTYGTCVGYKVPPFMGGGDTIGNLEVSDTDVYWTIVGQVLARMRGGAR